MTSQSTFTYHLTLPTSQYTNFHASIAIKILHWWGTRLLILPGIILLQFQSLFTNIPLLGLALSISKTIWESDYSMKFYNKRRHIKQNQPRMVLVWRTWLFFIKHCALRTSVTRSRYMAYWTQRSMAPWCLFDSFIREANCINVALKHSASEATCEELNKEEALLDCWDGSWIQGFSNAYNIRVMAKLGSVTYWTKPLERLGGMRKDRTILGRP